MAQPLAGLRASVRSFDRRVDAGLDHVRGRPVVDRIFYGASELGDFSLVWVLLGGLRGLRSERGWKAAIRLGVGLTAESFLVNGVVKSVFRRSRPPWEVDRPLRLRRPLTSSFPSGHATSSFMAALLLSEGDPAWPVYWVVAAVVAGSRVYVRIHHASDVVAGSVLGVGMGLAMRRLMPLPPVDQPASGGGAVPLPAS
ncbi:MAG: phosphatase PAP2 family protein [Acidimicrobiales bacterium]